MFKLALNAGHSAHTTRGVPASVSPKNHPNEWWLNNRIADKIEKLLAAYEGVSVLRIDDTTGQNDLSLTERTNKANAWGADFYLAIHHNGGINGGTGGGIVAYVYTKPQAKSTEWQTALYEALIKKTGLKGNRATPLAKQNLHEVREPKMPSVLLELGFMDSKTDVPVLLTEDYADKCAAAIVEVIVSRQGLKKRGETFKKGQTSLGVYAMKRLLWLLKEQGLVPAAVLDDGGFGDGTVKDVKAVQKAAKLTQTGIADEATVRAAAVQVQTAMKRLQNKLTLAAAENETLKAELAKVKAQLAAKGGTTK